MNFGKLVFAQVTQHLPLTTFRRCVARYGGAHKVKSFSCLDQFLSMAFAQLTYRESLRDIEACLRAQRQAVTVAQFASDSGAKRSRSEEHTSELQSRGHLVCRLLLEKKKKKNKYIDD